MGGCWPTTRMHDLLPPNKGCDEGRARVGCSWRSGTGPVTRYLGPAVKLNILHVHKDKGVFYLRENSHKSFTQNPRYVLN